MKFRNQLFGCFTVAGMLVGVVGCKSNQMDSTSTPNAVTGAGASHEQDYNSRMGGDQTNNMGQAAPTTMGSNTTR